MILSDRTFWYLIFPLSDDRSQLWVSSSANSAKEDSSFTDTQNVVLRNETKKTMKTITTRNKNNNKQ